MRIAQVAPPFESVPPARYGGTERVVSTLTEELVRRGHEVTLFASGDSRTSARLAPTVEQALWHQKPPLKDFAPYWAITLGHVWEHIEEFDVVHSHLDYFAYPMARAGVRPVVTTLHGRLDRFSNIGVGSGASGRMLGWSSPSMNQFYKARPMTCHHGRGVMDLKMSLAVQRH